MANSIVVAALATAVRLLSCRHYSNFLKNLEAPQESQHKVLARILKDLSKCELGAHHGITGSESYDEFAKKIPLASYEELEPWISRQLCTKGRIITSQRIVHVEPTSGSSGARKTIPYTKSLITSFSNMFRLWAYDHLTHGFSPRSGRIFISVSQPEGSGYADDSEYLREPLRSLVKPLLVCSPKARSVAEFQEKLAAVLLNEQDLEVISIWSPSYLLSLLSCIESERERFADLYPQHRQALRGEPIAWHQIWPKLQLLSCWDQALAEPQSNQLRKFLPNTRVQGKGLLATESPITVPLIAANGCVPLVDEVFLEFEASDGSIKQLHEVCQGDEYNLLVTQSAGLIRYRLNDTIRVTGKFRNTPLLSFVGRSGAVCDMVGEKLQGTFVCNAISRLVQSGNFTVVPVFNETCGHTPKDGAVIDPHYVLLTDIDDNNLHEEVETVLNQAWHYRQARLAGQLGPIQVCTVPMFQQTMQSFHESEGIKSGDIKCTPLITDVHKAARLLTWTAHVH